MLSRTEAPIYERSLKDRYLELFFALGVCLIFRLVHYKIEHQVPQVLFPGGEKSKFYWECLSDPMARGPVLHIPTISPLHQGHRVSGEMVQI